MPLSIRNSFLILSFFFFINLPLSVHSEELDLSFGKNGKILLSLSPTADRAEMIAIQKDHKIVVVGLSDFLKKTDLLLIRFLPNGKLDPSFGNEGKVFTHLGEKEKVYGLAIQKNGKIIIGGSTEKNGRMSDFAIARYLSNGDLDQTFGKEGKVIQSFGDKDEIHYLVLDEKEQIVVAGFSERGKKSKFILARYLPNGTPDLTFNQTGFISTPSSPEDRLYGLTLQKDGKILVTGSSRFDQKKNCVILRYLKGGNLDQEFGKKGIFFLEKKETVCSTIISRPYGKILVTGYHTNPEGNTDFLLVQIQSDGKLDNTFGENGIVTTDFGGGIDVGHALVIFPTGKILVGGEAQEFSEEGVSISYFALARYLPNGKLDSQFGDKGKIITRFGGQKNSSAEAMTLQENGKVILVGEGEGKFAIVRYLMR